MRQAVPNRSKRSHVSRMQRYSYSTKVVCVREIVSSFLMEFIFPSHCLWSEFPWKEGVLGRGDDIPGQNLHWCVVLYESRIELDNVVLCGSWLDFGDILSLFGTKWLVTILFWSHTRLQPIPEWWHIILSIFLSFHFFSFKAIHPAIFHLQSLDRR